MKKSTSLLSIIFIVLSASVIFAETIVKPYTFSNNTIADADEVNANFDLIINQLNRFGSLLTVESQTGYLGIGTADPQYALHVFCVGSGGGYGVSRFESEGNMLIDIHADIDGNAARDSFLRFATSGSLKYSLGYDASKGIFAICGGSALTDSYRLTLKAGKVGLGTDDPITNLHVYTTGGRVMEYITTNDDSESAYLVLATDYDGSAKYGGIALDGSDGSLKLATSGNPVLEDQLTLAPSGYVGIGTSEPEYALHAYCIGSGGGYGVARFESNGNQMIDIHADLDANAAADPVVRFGTGGSNKYSMGYDASKSIFAICGGSALTDSYRLTLKTGKVGLGTEDPITNLHVYTTGGRVMEYITTNDDSESAYLILATDYDGSASYGGMAVDGSNGYLKLATSGNPVLNNHLVLDTSGNVGIGIGNPGYRLDVDGDINISSGASYLTGGADYAEYFESEEEMVPGDVAGINPESGLIREYRAGDELAGIVSDSAGYIGNNEPRRSSDPNYVLVGLLGQLDFDETQTKISGRIVSTKDGKKIGFLLKNKKVFIK